MTKPDSAFEELLSFLYRAPVALLQAGLNGDISIMTPPAAALLLPLSPDGALDNLFQVLDPVAPHVRRFVAEFTAPSGVVCDDLHIPVAGGGGERPAVVLTLSILKIDADKLMVLFRDITEEVRRSERERRQMDLLLTELSTQRDQALALMDVAMIREDLQTGSVVLTPGLCERLFPGQRSAECTRDQFMMFVHEDDRAAFAEDWRHARGGVLTSFRDFRLRLAGGRLAWLAGRRHLDHDPEGHPISLTTLCLDVTEQRAAERERMALAERLNLAASAAGVGTFEITESSGSWQWSAQTYALHGYPADLDQDPQQIFTMVTEDHEHARFEVWLRDGFSGKALSGFEYQVTFPNGDAHWLACKGRLQRDSEACGASLIGVIWDVTEHRQVHTALESQRIAEHANSAKSKFLASMSHELRTPLNAILGYSETVLEGLLGPVTAEQEKALTTIESSGRHLLALINDILDLAKIESDKMEIYREPVSVADICTSSLSLVMQQALQKQITMFRPTVDDSLKISTDQRRLKQILINLLTNAVKFTPEEGSVGLEVLPDQSLGKIHFKIWDTGIGISAADRERLFKPFAQIANHQSRHQEGTGLGLSLAMQFTRLLGGELTLDSEPGQGTHARVTLPWGAGDTVGRGPE